LVGLNEELVLAEIPINIPQIMHTGEMRNEFFQVLGPIYGNGGKGICPVGNQ